MALSSLAGIHPEAVTVTHFLTGDEAHPGWYRGATSADDWIYYNKDSSGYQRVYRIKPDGTSNADISSLIIAANVGFPVKHHGCVEPRPDGAWIVMQVQRTSYTDDSAAFPGIGFGNDLYAVNTSTWVATQLTTSGVGDDHGALHARFSDDGGYLLWQRHSQSYADEPGETEVMHWYNQHRLCTATFTVTAGVPSVTVTEREASFLNTVCEPGDWVTNAKAIYCTNGWPGMRNAAWMLVELTLSSGIVRELVTTQSMWVEFARANASETLIAFTSTSGDDDDFVRALRQASDVWLCDMDGNFKTRLTHFSEVDHPHYTAISGNAAYKYAAGDPEWGSSDAAGNPRLICNLQRHTRLTGAFSRYGLAMLTLQGVA